MSRSAGEDDVNREVETRNLAEMEKVGGCIYASSIAFEKQGLIGKLLADWRSPGAKKKRRVEKVL